MASITDTLAQVKVYAGLGWQLVPLHGIRGGHCTCRQNSKCPSPGKHPRLNDWQNQATSDSRHIEAYFATWPDANLGLRLGPASNVVDIEFDSPEGEATANELLGDIATPTFQSHRSTHRLFRFPSAIAIGKAVAKVRGLECRFGTDTRGAQSVLPPSLHASGQRYRWLQSPSEVALANFPEYVARLLPSNGDGVLTMESDCDLASAPGVGEGQRNATLCRLVGSWLKAHGANAKLLELASAFGERCIPPMPQADVLRCVSNLVSKEQTKEYNKSKDQAKPTLATKCFSDILAEPVNWLWQNRIALGKLSLVVGQPGLGKTFVSLDIAAKVSTGENFSDGSPCPLGDVLYLTAEDGASDTLKPRLDAAGADVARISHIEGVKQSDGKLAYVSLASHLPAIASHLESNREIRLLVIDPLTAFLGDRCDSHKNADVRSILGPMSELAEKYRVAILGVTHLSKSEGKAINKVIGSIAFIAAARAGWLVACDPEKPERRFFVPIKNNLAQANGLAFSIVNNRVEWEPGEILVSPDDIDDETETPRGEASAWLQAILAEKAMPAKWILKQGRSEGMASRTIHRAKRELGIKSVKKGGAWVWCLPGQAELDAGEGVYVVT